MGGLDADEEIFKSYINSIEQQIEDKRFFLSQARNAIGSLHNGANERHAISPEQWQGFLKKPMFFPERSDPIGVSLASSSLVSRQETSEEWLGNMEVQLDGMLSMIRDQQRINQSMLVLIELLEQKVEKPLKDALVAESPLQRNGRLRRELEAFLKNYMTIDLANAEDSSEKVQRDAMKVISRLINYDTNLKTTDFPQSTKGLFRLLLRSNLIILHDESNARYVKLIDFAASDVA